jgi:LDH2 family malate/lactate/ureidoglycolate dehydrogenase
MKTYNHEIRRIRSGAYRLIWFVGEAHKGDVNPDAMRQVLADRAAAERFAAEHGVSMPEEPSGTV